MYKTHVLKLFCLGLSALTTLSLQAGTDTNTACQDGFHGVANLDQGLVLTATADAPAYAKGKARFIAVDDNGTHYEALFVKTVGLTNGVFTVRLADDTGNNTYTLGTLNVSTVTDCGGDRHHHHHDGGDEDQDNEDNQRSEEWQTSECWNGGWFGDYFPWHGDGSQSAIGWTNWVADCAQMHPCWTNLLNLGACTNLHCFATNTCSWYTNTLTVGSGSFILPDGLSETNAGVLTISDADGVVYLSGDFSSATNSTVAYHETTDLQPGTATNCQGSASITYRQVRARTVGTLRLSATGLPPHTKLYLTTNEARALKVFTSRNGTLNLRAFPRLNLSALTSLVATDASGNVVFSVNF